MKWSIDGKSVLVTGGTSGIGRATATELARQGALVTITSRDAAAASGAADEIRAASGGTVEGRQLDLASLRSVRDFAEGFRPDHDRLDVLVNNAGSMFGRHELTDDGFERTMAVNHFGPFLLTNLLMDRLSAAGESRVVTVSSENHRASKGIDFDDLQMQSDFKPSLAYARSKLANILFTFELDRRFGSQGVTARALHPGVVGTNFSRGEGPVWMAMVMRLLKPLLATPEKGASTSVHLATAPTPQLEGALYWVGREPKEPSQAALDADARRLWDVSAELVGLES